jgi:hypothetical protein
MENCIAQNMHYFPSAYTVNKFVLRLQSTEDSDGNIQWTAKRMRIQVLTAANMNNSYLRRWRLQAPPKRRRTSNKTTRCSELSSGLYCRVKWLSTDVSEVRTASIIRDEYTTLFPRRPSYSDTRDQMSKKIKCTIVLWSLFDEAVLWN